MSEPNLQSQAQQQAQQQAQPPADHSVKIPHLVFGLLFLGIAVVWALIVSDVITEDRLTVIAPGLLITAGVIGLAASLASTRNRNRNAALLYNQPHDDQTYEDQGNDTQGNDTQGNDTLFTDEQDSNDPYPPEHDRTQEIR